jgi:hypothetical protein
MEETDSVAKEVSHDEAMGRLTKDFAMLEYILHGVAWSLISEDRKIGEIITAGLSFLRVEEIVRELARHRLGEDDLRLMTEAVGLAETARKNRNDIIHSMWLQLGGGTGAPHQVSLRKGKRQFKMGEAAPTSKILAVVEDIDAAVQPLMAFLVLAHPALFDAGASKLSQYLDEAELERWEGRGDRRLH